MYPISAAAYKYRALRKGDAGNDVLALQTGLNVFADPDIVEDGVFGDRTFTAVRRYQKNRGLTADGIAGIQTQRSIAINVGQRVKNRITLPTGLLTGVFEKESGFQLGNHTAQYSNGSWDIGIVQRNSHYNDPESSFNVDESINVYAERVRNYFDKYANYDSLSNETAWKLAAGSWNAPAWTDTLAKGGTLKPSQKEWIDGYIARVTIYVVNWPD